MKTLINHLALFSLSLLLFQCKDNKKDGSKQVTESEILKGQRAKFEPKDGEVILFVGQELDAIGGTTRDSNGYFDHFDTPGGFTMYTDIMPGLTETFLDHSFTYTGLNGIWDTDNWGDGPNNMSIQLADEDFANCALAIGLAIIDNEEKIASGEHDNYIERLGEFLKSLGERPVFLRIGFEFAGPWNRYDRESYIKAYRRIKDKLDSQGVSNVAYVWQSKGYGLSLNDLQDWYPGDDYVDWCGYSFFHKYKEAKMIEFAEQRGKPVFIAEATPTSADTIADPGGNKGITKEFILSNPAQAQMAWDEWFIPFFETVDRYPETIKAISYINANWKAKPRWKVNPTFRGIDARLQLSKDLSKRWKEETGKPKYLKASSDLFTKLNHLE